ncbi:hypothetical protein FE257_011753 [Aspergillus nanangensis]|uniref:Uncharacterized protein n=1 Tax=Aspergillus nanangensis TaxID=2582783 RepID=A0AAD4GXX0_ASPNN|nr:hypothetical protein FE257_011753 [Aspergillus nanangensis]
MVFYAHIQTNGADAGYRYIIMAPRMEIVDEWYRAIATKKHDYDIRRVSPEFYTYNHHKLDVGHSTYSGRELPKFHDIMTFTPLDSRMSPTFTNQGSVDRISGNTFYIRSKSDPRVFWHERGGDIYASQRFRTRFRILNKDKIFGKQVMVDSDLISISPTTLLDGEVNVNDEDGLCIDVVGTDIALGDLKSHFIPLWNGDNFRIIYDQGNGEEWELVS